MDRTTVVLSICYLCINKMILIEKGNNLQVHLLDDIKVYGIPKFINTNTEKNMSKQFIISSLILSLCIKCTTCTIQHKHTNNIHNIHNNYRLIIYQIHLT